MACLPGDCTSDFNWVVFSGKRPTPAKNIGMITTFLEPSISFARTTWFVAFGDKPHYVKAGLCRGQVKELGTASDAVNGAIKLANSTSKPTIVMADDLRQIYHVTGCSSTWATAMGCRADVFTVTKAMLGAARSVSASLCGLHCTTVVRNMLERHVMSLCSFIIGDFFLLVPPVRGRWNHEACPKEDYAMSCDTLVKGQLTCRLNHYSIDCEHYQPGGDGPMRVKGDCKAVAFLNRKYPGVFRRKYGERGQVIMYAGIKLLGEELREAVTHFTTIMERTQHTQSEIKQMMSRSSKVRSKAKSKKSHAPMMLKVKERERKRRQRGRIVHAAGLMQRGRARMCQKVLSKSLRTAISRAKARLRALLV